MRKIILMFVILLIGVALIAEPLKLVTLKYPPYQYLEGERITGKVPPILDKTFFKLGYEIEISVHPWEKSLEMVKNKEADAIFTIFKTPEREKFLNYSDVILVMQKTAFFSKTGSDLDFTGNMEDIKDLSIGVVNSVSYGDIFDNGVKDNNLKTVVFKSTEACFKALIEDKVDLVVNNLDGANFLINEMKINKLVTQNGPAIEEIPSYLAFAKKDGLNELKIKFDEMLPNIMEK